MDERRALERTVEQRDTLLKALKFAEPHIRHSGAAGVVRNAIQKVEHSMGVSMADLREEDR